MNMIIKIPFKTPTIKCKNCGNSLKPAGANKTVGKNRKYCGKRVCQAKRVSLWQKNRKHLESVKERCRINQRKYCKQEKVKKMYKEYMKIYFIDYKRNRIKKDPHYRDISN